MGILALRTLHVEQFREQHKKMQQDREQRIYKRIRALCLQQETGRKKGSEGLVDLDSISGADTATHDAGLGPRNFLRRNMAECGFGLHVQVKTNKLQPTAEISARNG